MQALSLPSLQEFHLLHVLTTQTVVLAHILQFHKLLFKLSTLQVYLLQSAPTIPTASVTKNCRTQTKRHENS